MIRLFFLLSPFALIAGIPLGFALYACYILTMDVAAKDIIISQKSEEAEVAVAFVEAKGLLGKPVKKISKRRKVK